MLTRPFLRRKTFCTERIPMRRTGIALVILTVLALPCVAQTPPEWSGYYTLASGKDLGNFKPLNR